MTTEEANGKQGMPDPELEAANDRSDSTVSLHTTGGDSGEEDPAKAQVIDQSGQPDDWMRGSKQVGNELSSAIHEGVKSNIVFDTPHNTTSLSYSNSADNKSTAPTRTDTEPKESGDMRRHIDAFCEEHGNHETTVAQRLTNETVHRYRRVGGANASSRSQSFGISSSHFTSPRHLSVAARNDRGNQRSADDVSWSPSMGDSSCLAVRSNGQLASKTYPIIYAAPTGTMFIILNFNVIVEIAIDRSVRIVCHDKFSSVCNSSGTTACILHPKARIYQHEEKVFCYFSTSSTTYKAAAFGPQGVLFTMSHLNKAYLVSSSAVPGTSEVPLGQLQFPSLNYDFTIAIFYGESRNGGEYIDRCNEIAKEARHGKQNDGSLTITINGIFIKQTIDGDVEVNLRPRRITCSPSKGTISVRTDAVNIAVEEDEKAYVKHGMKNLHVSRSGMVVSDGSYITSMDHLGRVVSCV